MADLPPISQADIELRLKTLGFVATPVNDTIRMAAWTNLISERGMASLNANEIRLAAASESMAVSFTPKSTTPAPPTPGKAP
jgi:hypothetical protein